jgi:hypothetical protein
MVNPNNEVSAPGPAVFQGESAQNDDFDFGQTILTPHPGRKL